MLESCQLFTTYLANAPPECIKVGDHISVMTNLCR